MHIPPDDGVAQPAHTPVHREDGGSAPDIIARISRGDRRHDGRAPFVSRVAVTLLDSAGRPCESWDCTSHNLSRDGLAFSSRRRIELNTRVIVETPSSIPGRNVPYCGIVHQVRQAAQDNFVIGISFEPMPQDPEIHDWLARRPTLPDE